MTNEQIIMNNAISLMKAGIIKGTGETVKLIVGDTEIETEMPEAIHTFAGWKALGFSVRKGEHAVANFPIWKYTERQRKESELTGNPIIDANSVSNMFMKNSFFFSASQVEKI